jgi:cytoskeleton protein RodZ
MTKGDERTLAGTPPYSCVIGNAGATSISVNDRPIDLAGRSKGNVARFKLDPANP